MKYNNIINNLQDKCISESNIKFMEGKNSYQNGDINAGNLIKHLKILQGRQTQTQMSWIDYIICLIWQLNHLIIVTLNFNCQPDSIEVTVKAETFRNSNGFKGLDNAFEKVQNNFNDSNVRETVEEIRETTEEFISDEDAKNIRKEEER